MALREYEGGENVPPATANGTYVPSQHALSFEGARRFWKPKDERESTWRRLMGMSSRPRALSGSNPQDTELSLRASPQPSPLPSPRAVNVGEWLTAQDIVDVPEPPDIDESNRTTNHDSPVSKLETRNSVGISITSSDSVSVHTVSSTTSLPNKPAPTRFKSLSDQIADDERRRNAKRHLMRIMEAEEARVAQYGQGEDASKPEPETPVDELAFDQAKIEEAKFEELKLEEAKMVDIKTEESRVEKGQPSETDVEAIEAKEDVHDKEKEEDMEQTSPELSPVQETRIQSQFLPNALRLTFEPSVDDWNIDEFLYGKKDETTDLGNSETTSVAQVSSITEDRTRKNSTEGSSVHTVTATSEKPSTEIAPPSAPAPEVESTTSLAQSISSAARDLSPEPAVEPAPTQAPTLNAAPQLRRGSHASVPPRPRPSSPLPKSRTSSPPRETPTSRSPSPPRARPSSTVSALSERCPTPALTISPAPTPPPDTSPLPSVTDTLFQDLNRLKMTSSRRQELSRRLMEDRRGYTVPTGIPKVRRNPSPSMSSLTPPSSSTSPALPQQRPVSASFNSNQLKALPPPPPEPRMSSNTINAIELSTSLSVVHRPKAPRADDKYRRTRQHSDAGVYNTLPTEPYPLLGPEARVEAPPSEEEMEVLQRVMSPRKSMDVSSSNEPSINIEPDIDPRTGLPWMHRAPLNPFGATGPPTGGRKAFRLF